MKGNKMKQQLIEWTGVVILGVVLAAMFVYGGL